MHTQKSINQIAYNIVGCAIEVHRELGPGLLESIYQKCLMKELLENNYEVKQQVPVHIYYKDFDLGKALRLDLLVEDLIIVEIKAVEEVHPVHKYQLKSYMKLAQKPKGLLINFNVPNISQSVVPIVNELFAALPEK